MSDTLIADEVVGVAKTIEGLDDPYDDYFDPLEWYVEANPDGDLREIILVMTTGGPHIEVLLFRKIVRGWWDGHHDCPIFDSDDLLDELADHYTDLWRSNLRHNP